MKFNDRIMKYLHGQVFSNSLVVPLGRRESGVHDRVTVLAGLARGKNVIHVGFADHAELIAEKIKKNAWLHAHISRNAQRCLGVDVNEDAVEFVRTHVGMDDVFVHDLTADVLLPAITSQTWDWLFLPEVLEHVDDPVNFLTKVRQLYGGVVNRALITVPNALELTNLRFLLRREECVNSDHRYWFTPYTLAKVCTRAGWQVEEFFYCQGSPPSSRLRRALLSEFPPLREAIVMLLRTADYPG